MQNANTLRVKSASNKARFPIMQPVSASVRVLQVEVALAGTAQYLVFVSR